MVIYQVLGELHDKNITFVFIFLINLYVFMLHLIIPHYIVTIGKIAVIPNYLIKNLSFNLFGQGLFCDA